MKRLAASLPLQILIAVLLGIALGFVFPGGELKAVSDFGKVIIHWVKLIAGPFLFLTILASIIEVQVEWKHGARVVAIALINTLIAVGIGIGLAALFLSQIQLKIMAPETPPSETPVASLGFSSWIKTLMPESFFTPFVQNDVLLIAVLSLVVGLAVRKVYDQSENLTALTKQLEKLREIPALILNWLIHLIPFAVLAVVAGAVSEHGLSFFISLFQYVGVVILGFCLQIGIVYGFWLFVVAKIPFSRFLREIKEPVSYAFGVNSSLATLPLTLKALKNLGISSRASSLGAGVATNLNNDGIVLYEAMAAFFIAQINHIPLDFSQMLAIALTCIIASMGITGIPEAGFISLSVVLTALKLPTEALPLLLSVDWLVGRGRSVVNVLSDITLSVALDAVEPAGITFPEEHSK